MEASNRGYRTPPSWLRPMLRNCTIPSELPFTDEALYSTILPPGVKLVAIGGPQISVLVEVGGLEVGRLPATLCPGRNGADSGVIVRGVIELKQLHRKGGLHNGPDWAGGEHIEYHCESLETVSGYWVDVDLTRKGVDRDHSCHIGVGERTHQVSIGTNHHQSAAVLNVGVIEVLGHDQIPRCRKYVHGGGTRTKADRR